MRTFRLLAFALAAVGLLVFASDRSGDSRRPA